MKLTKKDIENQMLPQIDLIIDTWDKEGIIIETQFDFAYQSLLKNHVYINIAYEIIVDNGGHAIEEQNMESDSNIGPMYGATEITNAGFMYFFYDYNYYLEFKDAINKVKKYFKANPIIY